MKKINFKFHGNLNLFVKKDYEYKLLNKVSIKDIVQSIGIPHTEIALIVINNNPVRFSYLPVENDFVEVFPYQFNIPIKYNGFIYPDLPSKVKFMVDANVGKLIKNLRLCGFDSIFAKSLDDKDVADISYKENRVVLSKDIGLLKRNKVVYGYLVRSEKNNDQLIEVIRRYQLKEKVNAFTICIDCNGSIIKIDKNEVINQLKPKTKLFYNDFYICKSCNKVYWKGSHYKNMIDLLNKI